MKTTAHRKYFDIKILVSLLVLIAGLLMISGLSAQNIPAKHKYISFGLNGSMAVPLNEFYYKSDQLFAGGMQLNLFYHPRKFDKFYLGAGFSYLNYGLETYFQDVDIDGAIWEVETLRQYDIYFPHLKARLQPWNDKKLIPVFQGFIGPRAFVTASTFTYEEEPSVVRNFLNLRGHEKTIREIEFIDWTFGYGFTVGINYFICNFLDFEVLLDYVDGGPVKFLTRKDIEFDPVNNEYYYTPRYSDSNLLQLNLGFIFHIF